MLFAVARSECPAPDGDGRRAQSTRADVTKNLNTARVNCGNTGAPDAAEGYEKEVMTPLWGVLA